MHVSESSVLPPFLAMVGLTFVVWVKLLTDRFREMAARKIHPRDLASAAQISKNLQNIQSTDNFRNLFEVPVLFYAFCLVLMISNVSSPSWAVGLWIYVGLRWIHSYIHCTYNNVRHRAVAYILSSLLLLMLWGVFAARALL